MHLIMGYGFYKYYYGVRELKYVPTLPDRSRLPMCESGGSLNIVSVIGYSADGFQLCSELAREKMWSRIHLTPLLQAEEDRDQVRRHFADQAREKELLGTETSPYHSDRYANSYYGIFFAFETLESLGDTNRTTTDSSARASHIPPATSLNSELEKPQIQEHQPRGTCTAGDPEIFPAMHTILFVFHLLQLFVGFQPCAVKKKYDSYSASLI